MSDLPSVVGVSGEATAEDAPATGYRALQRINVDH